MRTRRLVQGLVPLLLFMGCALAQAGNGPPEYELFPGGSGRSGFFQPPHETSSGHSTAARLPSDEELFAAMTAGQRDAMAAGQQANQLHQVRDWPWNPTRRAWTLNEWTPGTLRAQGTFHEFQLNGRTFGPYTVGGARFEAKSYPHDLPFLQNTYDRTPRLLPIDFDHLIRQNIFLANEQVFRPDPHTLDLVQRRVLLGLSARGWYPARVGGNSQIFQGEYLWPPVKPTSKGSGLDMSRAVRTQLFHGVKSRLKAHNTRAPMIWHLQVPEVDHTTRHIMMTPVDWESYTDIMGSGVNSDLWLLHEAQVDPRALHEPMLALLGAMFLPKGAAGTLNANGVIKPAFSHLISAH